MKKYKFLVVDYDGTLVNDQKIITKKTKNAINEFISRGGIFVVCSGRMTTGIEPLLKRDGLTCKLLSYNGAEFKDLESNKMLFKKAVDNKTSIEVFKCAESLNLNVQGYSQGTFVTKTNDSFTEFYSRLNNVKAIICDKVSDYFKKSGEENSKILVFDEKEKLDKSFQIIKNKFENLNVIRSNDLQIDITHKEVSKGSAIKHLANFYGVSVDDIIAVGDAGNDIPMLETAGLSIAMGNAYQSVKDICDVIVSDNNNDGIAEIIEKFTI